MQTEVQESEKVPSMPEGLAQKLDRFPLLSNRSQRRAKTKAKRVEAMKKLRHAKKHDPAVRQRVMLSRVRLCPACHLDFLGSVNRCQCKAQKPTKSM